MFLALFHNGVAQTTLSFVLGVTLGYLVRRYPTPLPRREA